MNGKEVSLAKIAELVEFDQAIAASGPARGALLGVCRIVSSRNGPRRRRPPRHRASAQHGARGLLDAHQDVGAALRPQAGITFVEAEQELFGVNHAAVGAAIAVACHFPDVVTDAIARHHDNQLGESTPVLDAVVIANMVAKNIGVGLGAEGFNLTVDSTYVRRLGLDFTRFARICLQTDTWLRELRQAQK